jgi:hypothetical protein
LILVVDDHLKFGALRYNILLHITYPHEFLLILLLIAGGKAISHEEDHLHETH